MTWGDNHEGRRQKANWEIGEPDAATSHNHPKPMSFSTVKQLIQLSSSVSHLF